MPWKYIARFLVSKTWSNFNKFGTKPKLHHDDLKPYSWFLPADLLVLFTVFSVVRYLPFIYRNYRQLRPQSLEIFKDQLKVSIFQSYELQNHPPPPYQKKQNLNPPTNIPCALQIQNQTPNHKPQPQPQPQPNLTLTSPPNSMVLTLQRGTRCRMFSASNSFLLRQPSVAVAAPDSASRRWEFPWEPLVAPRRSL